MKITNIIWDLEEGDSDYALPREIDVPKAMEDEDYDTDLWGFEEIWDRPLSEIDEVVESGSPVVLVDCSYSENGNLVKEYRWFELP